MMAIAADGLIEQIVCQQQINTKLEEKRCAFERDGVYLLLDQCQSMKRRAL